MSTTLFNEQQLISLLQQKDKEAVKLIFHRFGKALQGVVLQIVRDDESIAEDVLQESLVKIWKNGPQYDPGKGKTLYLASQYLSKYGHRQSSIQGVSSKPKHPN